MRARPLALVLALVACTAEHTAPAADAGTDAFDAPVFGDLVTDFCAPLAERICTRAMQCGCDVVDLDACVRNETADCVRSPPSTMYDGEQLSLYRAHACLALLEAADACDPFADRAIGTTRCDDLFANAHVFAPTCRELEPCDSGRGLCLAGECVALGLAGEPCSTSGCVDGSTCVNEPSFPDALCMPLVAVGDVCHGVPACVAPARCIQVGAEHRCALSVAEGGACASEDDCAARLACVGGRCTTPTGCDDCGRAAGCFTLRTCQPPLALGEACHGFYECGDGGSCEGGVCVARLADGARCGGSGPDCRVGSACVSAAGMQSCRPLATRGEPCGMGLAPCVDPLACVGAVCGDAPSIGSACADDHRCVEGAWCTSDGVCVPLGGAGDACSPDALSCGAGLQCGYDETFAGATCLPIPAIGDVCIPNHDDCACIADASGVPVCRAPRALGDPCSTAAPCPTGSVCRGSGVTRCVAAVCPNDSY